MKKILILMGKWIGIFLVIILGALHIIDFSMGQEFFIDWTLQDIDQPQKHKKIDGVHYLEIGDTTKTPLVLVHGAPGGVFDWKGMLQNEKLYDDYFVVVPVRRGYGLSSYWPEPSIVEHTNDLEKILDTYDTKSVLFGHSYGAPIVVLAGAIYPQKIEQIYGISGQYKAETEFTFPISYYIDNWLGWVLLPRSIWTSNREKLTHPQAQKDIEEYWKKVAVPVTLAHGDKDSLVQYENSVWLLPQLPNAELITLKNIDHPVQMSHPDKLVGIILNN